MLQNYEILFTCVCHFLLSRIYQEFEAGKSCDEVFSLKKEEEDDFDTFFDTPLMIKFIAKYVIF